MRPIVATASMLALLAGAPGLATAQTNGPGTPPGPSSMPNMAAPGTGGSSPEMTYGQSGPERREANQQDRKFVEAAGSAGLAEVTAGHLAMRRAANPAVSEFGRWMVTDHTEMGDMLGYRAERAGLTPPSRMSEKDRAAIDRLERYNGTEFDLHYLADQVEGHKQAMELFKQEGQSGGNPGLRAFAQHMEKMITEHLAEAQELQGAPESGTAHSAQVSTPPAPMPGAKNPPSDLQAGTTPEVRNNLNAGAAERVQKEGK
jgi:putative membrane protein